MKNFFSLDGSDWTLRPVGASEVPGPVLDAVEAGIPATVPGCVHTDLMAAGLLDDPYLADNELRQFWIGRNDWAYERTLELTADLLARERVELVCEGLDTIATVRLNGREIGRSENMHCAKRFDLKAAAIAGQNRLTITFAAPMIYAEQQELIYPDLPHAGAAGVNVRPYHVMRKMACNMGWDWGPEVTTSGIWRPIRVEAWDYARIAYVRPLVSEASAEEAVVDLHVDLERAGERGIRVEAELQSPDGVKVVATAQTGDGRATLRVENPERWWPLGHGAQPLYTLAVTLTDELGTVLDRWSRRIGLRTTELETRPDTEPFQLADGTVSGESMQIKVNGKPIYCKGANWIPDDCFPHRVTPARFAERIGQAVAAHMNMLRVWGGGLYEDEAFYDCCDELGVMVWQDFLFACACYPEEKAYRDLVEEEVRDNVCRLASHASLVIWNGCNENIWATFDWSPEWQKIRTDGQRAWGLGYYLDLLPRWLAELDPSRPYWPGSPYSGSMDRRPAANEYGNVHIWDVWHGAGQYRNYLAYYPRMASEFGYHGPACYATVAASIPPEERWWNSPLMQLHNKNGRPGQIQTNERMGDDFIQPTDNYDSWHYLAQVMQARALAMGIEWFRALYPWNSGALFWQLNDCWPVSSWSAIDGYGREKPLLHAARRFFAPRLVTIKPRFVTAQGSAMGELCVYLHNDSDEPWSGSCRVRQMTLAGELMAAQETDVEVAARALIRLDVPAEWTGSASTFLVAEIGELRGFWWFVPDFEMAYPAPKFAATLDRTPAGYRLTIRAETLLRDLCIFPDRLDPNAKISDACVTLLPGELASFDLTTEQTMTVESLTTAPVLNCANFFGQLSK